LFHARAHVKSKILQMLGLSMCNRFDNKNTMTCQQSLFSEASWNWFKVKQINLISTFWKMLVTNYSWMASRTED